MINTISGKLAIVYSLMALVLVSLQIAFSLYFDTKANVNKLDIAVEELLNTEKKPASQAVFDVNLSHAKSILLGLKSHHYITKALITDELGIEFYKVEKKEAQETQTVFLTRIIVGVLQRDFIANLEHKDYPNSLGTITISVNYDWALQEFYQKLFYSLKNTLLRTLIIFVGVFFVTRWFLGEPLNKIVDSIKSNNSKNKTSFYLTVPKWHDKTEIGVLVRMINEAVEKRVIAEQELMILNQSLEKRIEKRTLELEKMNGELEKLATLDGLTGINNRRSFLGKAEEKLSYFRRYKRPLSIMMLDIDHFKKINDQYGHQIGDLALITCVNICQKNLRETDLLGRLGGEEFALLLPETDSEMALNVAERIRISMPQNIDLVEKGIVMTVSIGVYLIDFDKIKSLAEALDFADKALYIAKNSGRNQTVFAENNIKS